MIFDPVKIRDALKVTFNNKLTSEEIAASSYQQACSQVATSLVKLLLSPNLLVLQSLLLHKSNSLD
jgi:hypothetical protein